MLVESHENALKEAYKEGKRISSQKLQSLQAFTNFNIVIFLFFKITNSLKTI